MMGYYMFFYFFLTLELMSKKLHEKKKICWDKGVNLVNTVTTKQKRN